MKTRSMSLILAAALLIGAALSPVISQTINATILRLTSAPTSQPCTYRVLAVDAAHQSLYGCDANTWFQLGGTANISSYFGNIPTLTSPGAVGSYTWVNQGSTTATASNGGIYMAGAAVSGTHSLRALVIATPATPYEYEAAVGLLNPATNVWDALTGIVARDSATGKLFTCQLENDNLGSEPNQFANFMFTSATFWSSATSPTSDQVLDYYRMIGWNSQPLIRYGDNGTNRYCEVSMDGGNNWMTYVNEGRTLNVTANQIGWFADVYEGTGTSNWAAMLMSWRRTI